MIDYAAFWDELEKISSEIPVEDRPLVREEPRQIQPGMLGKLLRYGIPAAGAVGVGYGTARLVGRPLERYLLEKGVGPRAASFLRYAVPIGAGLGAGYTLAGNKLVDELVRKVSGDDAATTQRDDR
jgi:hypothetical protein